MSSLYLSYNTGLDRNGMKVDEMNKKCACDGLR